MGLPQLTDDLKSTINVKYKHIVACNLLNIKIISRINEFLPVPISVNMFLQNRIILH